MREFSIHKLREHAINSCTSIRHHRHACGGPAEGVSQGGERISSHELRIAVLGHELPKFVRIMRFVPMFSSFRSGSFRLAQGS